MGILSLIATTNYIIVNKEFIKEFGLNEAIMLGELASEYDYWLKKGELEDEYFYSTIEKVQENTTLTAYQQRMALNNLKDIGIIDIKIKGIPAKRYIKIFEEQVVKKLNSKLLKNLTTGCKKTKQLDVKKLNGNNNIIINNEINNKINNNNIYISEFDELWKEYPNKKSKSDALKHYIKSREKGATYEQVKLGIIKYNEYIKYNKIDMKYVKHGSTWFNQECWNDDYSYRKELTTKDIADKVDFSAFR